MNNKDCINFFGTMETKRVLKVDYPTESSSLEVDQSDFLHGTELVEINDFGGESLLEDFNFDDNIFPLDLEMSEILDTDQLMSSYSIDHVVNTSPVNVPSSSKSGFQLLPNSFSSHSSLYSGPTNSITLQEFLKKETKSQKSLCSPIFGTNVLGSEYMLASKSRENLSQSAPTHLGLDQMWQRREPRQHLLSTGSVVEARSISSLSTGDVLTPDAYEFPLDDTNDNIEPESNNDSEDRNYSGTFVKYKDTFFWEYNGQSKGPKSQRLVLKCKLKDPHCLNEVTDPVFSPNCPIQGIKHSGKARKGDGNDLRPNPKKLLSIGRELDKLNKIIAEMTPTSKLPVHERRNARKEKNKLSSRVCRLKKIAKHQANKIKLFGLKTEHEHLNKAIDQLKQILVTGKTSDSFPKESQELTNASKKIVENATKLKVADRTTEFVNEVLEKLKLGIQWGGLTQL